MAKKVCLRCNIEQNLAAFISTNSIMHNGTLPICRKCLAKQLETAKAEGKLWNVADKICQWADVPFLPEQFEEIYQQKGRDAMGAYCSIFRGKPYDTLDWGMYNDAYLRVREENRVEDALPQIKEHRQRKLREKWGANYLDDELEYLENLHQGLLNSQNIVGALNEDQALKLCKISLIIEQKIRAGEDFDKDLRAYDALSKLANLTPKTIKDANEFNSAGELFAYLEKKDVKIDYYDGKVRDEVDYTMKNIKYWLWYLYTNETGVAEEIEQRIQNLKVAAQLSGTEFDEEEFREYASKQNGVDVEEEEFQVEF